jgi:3-oxoacyl-[acyl-carrier-protein] synthase II
MKLGEGYAIVVLERAADAHRRGATIRAMISGSGESADAHHLTQSHPQGAGAARAMRTAMAQAGVEAGEIDLIAAHATGTPDNDAAEYAALRDVLGDQQLGRTPVVCFKTHLGHTLGAAGAAELILSTMALRYGVIPPTLNVDPSQQEFAGLRLSSGVAAKAAVRRTMNLSLGFGGANACMILSEPPAPASPQVIERPKPAQRDVWITGIGVVLPDAIGVDAFLTRMRLTGAAPACQSPPPPMPDDDAIQLPNARRARRMSRYTKLMLAAAYQACGHAQLLDQSTLLAETGAILGTTHGAIAFCHEYYQQIVREGALAANPALFAEGVPNVGSAQLSLMLGLNGPCQTIIGTRTAGLDALRLARMRIAGGQAERIIVGAAEEAHPLFDRVYQTCGAAAGAKPPGPPYASTDGFRSAWGAVAFVLESAESARARGVQSHARVNHAAGSSGPPEALPRTLANILRATPATKHFIGSGSGTWVDPVELSALSRADGIAAVGEVCSDFGESFSVAPLAGAAAAMLLGRLPNVQPLPGRDASDANDELLKRVGILCTDWQGGVASAHLDFPR